MDYRFKSDGCSASLDLDQLWSCVVHDWEYWQGGTVWEKIKSDWKFAKDIWTTSKYWYTAPHRFLGVTIFGWFPNPKFRWGFGWKYPRYRAPKYNFSRYTIKSQMNTYQKVLTRIRDAKKEFEEGRRDG